MARNKKLLKPTARNSERNVQAEQNPNNAQAEQEYGKNCSRNVQAKQNPTARRRHRSTSSSAAAAYMQNRTKLRAGGTGRAHLHPQRTCKTEPKRAQAARHRTAAAKYTHRQQRVQSSGRRPDCASNAPASQTDSAFVLI